VFPTPFFGPGRRQILRSSLGFGLSAKTHPVLARKLSRDTTVTAPLTEVGGIRGKSSRSIASTAVTCFRGSPGSRVSRFLPQRSRVIMTN